MVADDLVDLVPQTEDPRHLGPAQVEVAVPQSQLLRCLDPILDRERRGVRGGEHLGGPNRDLDLPGRQVRVHRALGSSPDLAHDPDDRLALEGLRDGVCLGRILRVEHELNETLPIAQVDERHAAVIALAPRSIRRA